MCIDVTYTDADGKERLLFDPCELHKPKEVEALQ